MRGTALKLIAGLMVFAISTITAGAADAIQNEKGNTLPQELQPSAQPARERVIPEGWYPVTRVRLPERMQKAANEPEPKTWYSNFVIGDNDIFQTGDTIADKNDAYSDVFIDKPWYSSFAAGGNTIFPETKSFEAKTGAWYENFAAGGNDIFEDSYEDAELEPQAGLENDSYLMFGSAIVESTLGYASMPLPEHYYEEACEGSMEDGESVRLPKPFSFGHDDSPVILADVASPGPARGSNRQMASARVRVNRTYDGGRRPAEIIERTPANIRPRPRPNPYNDIPAMAPPAGGNMPRAEVKLPTSSQGLGMASGFFPGR